MAENGNRPSETFPALGTGPRRVWAVAALGALVVLGWVLRVANAADVFRDGEINLLPSDSHYYIRFALLQLEAFPRFVRFDPLVNAPTGASILWPPLHTWLVALGVLLGGRGQPELGAAWVGPVLSMLWLVGLGSHAWRRFGPGLALACVGALATLPAVVTQGALGNCDHHVHEPFLLALAVLTQAELWRTLERRQAILAGVVLGLGRWLTPAAFVFVVPAAVGVLLAAWATRDPRVPRRGLELAGVTAAVLLVSALLVGEPLALDYERLSAFHALFAFATIGGSAALAGVLLGQRRLALWLAPAILCAVPLVASLMAAVGHLGRGDPLLEVVDESKPLVTLAGWRAYLGVAVALGPLAVFGAGWALVRRREVAVGPALAAVLGLTVATAVQQRFGRALDGALAVLIPMGLAGLTRKPRAEEWAAASGGGTVVGAAGGGSGVGAVSPLLRPLRLSLIALVALCALLSPILAWPAHEELYVEMLARPTLRWMRTHTPPPEVVGGKLRPGTAVVAPFVFGHLVLLWAERPAVATPFSQAPWHVRANAEAAAVLSATDDDDALARMKALGARHLLATPFSGMLGSFRGDASRTLVARLLDGGGFEPASGHFRLLRDSAEQRRRPQGGSFARLFEAVEGARLEGTAAPGEWVEAELPVRSNLGTVHEYRRREQAGADGRFSIRVAYPVDPGSGDSPRPTRAWYEVRAGARLLGSAQPVERDVLEGRPVTVIAAAATPESGPLVGPASRPGASSAGIR